MSSIKDLNAGLSALYADTVSRMGSLEGMETRMRLEAAAKAEAEAEHNRKARRTQAAQKRSRRPRKKART